ISGSEDGTALVWDVAGVLTRQTRQADEETLWRALAGEDAVAAYEAICALAARRDVGLFAKRLGLVAAPDAAKTNQLLVELDSSQFATRQKAERELAALKELAEPELRKAVAESRSLEVR